VAHTCNPSYLEDPEDWGLRPVQANSFWDPVSKITTAKNGLEMWLKQESTCFATIKSWVQTLVPPKNQTNQRSKKRLPQSCCYTLRLQSPPLVLSNPAATLQVRGRVKHYYLKKTKALRTKDLEQPKFMFSKQNYQGSAWSPYREVQ
jgi:hypothetical protein